MPMRFCPKCDQDVEATSGYCLLGHRLALDPPIASIGELRDEVDRAFEDADLEVAAVASNSSSQSAVARSVAPVAPLPVSNAVAPSASVGTGVAQAPPRPRRVGPPPPPPPRRAPTAEPAQDAPGRVPTKEELMARKANVWKDLDADIDLAGDPIGAFAPPPTMDWGPSSGGILKRKPTRGFKRSKRSKAESKVDDSQD